MSIIDSFAIIGLAGLVHACFQLSISVLTLMSGHIIGSGKSQSKLLRMTASFVFGSVVMTLLILAFVCLVSLKIFSTNVSTTAWMIGCALLISSSLLILFFYYRKSEGTALWIPRDFAKYLTDRSKKTKMSGEAFGLGLSSVFSELPFIVAPVFISSLAILQLPSSGWQILAIAFYCVISIAPLLTVWALVNRGHSLSSIQRWREANKSFLQFTSCVGLAVIVFYVSINEILFSLVDKML